MRNSETFLNGKVVLHCGDNREILRGMADCSVDSIVTDPPYALVSIMKRFGNSSAAPLNNQDTKTGRNGAYNRASAGFMGKKWDTGETAHAVDFWAECFRVLKPGGHLVSCAGTRTYHRMTVAIEDAGFEIRDMISWLYGSGFPKSHNAGNGWGTALKPACEPICLARKPLIGTVAQNVLEHGTGAINIDGCRVGTDGATTRSAQTEYGASGWRTGHEIIKLEKGRWPANIIHDGSDEVIAAFPETTSGLLQTHHKMNESENTSMSGKNYARSPNQDSFGDSGSAARFFYTAKADSDDRLGSRHPTVKPVDLMQWLCRLVTPKGGTVLDPFAGTGTTGEAAFREGFNAILIEREEEYQADIRRRMGLVLSGPDERARESIKARTAGQPIDAGPLFGGLDTPPRGAGESTEYSRTNNRTDGTEVVG